jgi:hypothetical protein
VSTDPKDRRTDEPSTEEALPGLELGSDEQEEETGRETLGPEAAEEAEEELGPSRDGG